MRTQVGSKFHSKTSSEKQAEQHHSVPGSTPNAKTLQLQKAAGNQSLMQLIQRKQNKTGMPDQLKAGIENLSGYDLSDVKVHYNSSKPAEVNALAYAQGNDIHLGAGQEQHLPHESWHVVQQRQGRVQPTIQTKGIAINDNESLEKEADVMGAKALQAPVVQQHKAAPATPAVQMNDAVAQMKDDYYPSGDKEPHIHIHHGGITYTGVGHNHKALQRGDQVRESAIQEAYQELQALGTARAQSVIDWMVGEFGIQPNEQEEEEVETDENLPTDWVEQETADHNPEGKAPAGFSFGSYTSKLT